MIDLSNTSVPNDDVLKVHPCETVALFLTFGGMLEQREESVHQHWEWLAQFPEQ